MKTIFMTCMIIVLTFFKVVFAEDKVVLLTGEWAPYTSAKLPGYGFFCEIVTAIFGEVGITAEYHFMPWKRCEQDVKTGRAFATFPYAVTTERKKRFDFSDAVVVSKGKFFFMKKRIKQDIDWNTFGDLKPYRIGGSLGYWYEKAFKDAGLTVDYAKSDKLSIRKLEMGRVDLVASEELVGWVLIKELFPDEINAFATLKKPMNVSELHLMISKNYPHAAKLKDKFNTALKQIKAKGIYSAIFKKYNLTE